MKKLAEEDIARGRQAWKWALILTLVISFFFLRPFVSLILLASLLAFFTNPIYEWLLLKLKGKSGLAAALTTTALFLILAIPTAVVLAIAVAQAIVLIDNLGLGQLLNDNLNGQSSLTALTEDANQLITQFTGLQEAISTDTVNSFVKSTLPQLITYVTDSILSIVASIPGFFMNLIIFLFVYIGILTNSKQLLETLQQLSPFDREVNKLYFKRIGIMANAMLKAQFLIAFLQGLATAIGLYIVGLDGYFFFFLMLFTFMSLIPLGAGIITIPLGIFAILTGSVWQGLVILGNHFIVVTNIDNIRPRLVPEEARMQSALTILAAFAGVFMFGLVGVIYGPIIMIVLVTTIETYIKVKKKYEIEGV